MKLIFGLALIGWSLYMIGWSNIAPILLLLWGLLVVGEALQR